MSSKRRRAPAHDPLPVAIRVIDKNGFTQRELSTDIKNHSDWYIRTLRWAIREGFVVVTFDPAFAETFDRED